MTDLYRAITDPIRRKILLMTSQKECTQSEIVKAFSISQPAIKKHLKILLDEELILERKSGRFCYYRLNQEVYNTSYRELQHELGLILENKLLKLKNYLEEEKT